jgi:hypothetical protein
MIAIYAVIIAVVFSTSSPGWGECAWVLWEQTTHGLGGQTWTEWQSSGYPTSEKCEAVRRGMITAIRGKPGWEVSGDLLQFRGEGVTRFTRLSCLPDTVDPRGPKGGGR